MVDQGHDLFFGKNHITGEDVAYATHRETGQRTYFTRVKGVYEMQISVDVGQAQDVQRSVPILGDVSVEEKRIRQTQISSRASQTRDQAAPPDAQSVVLPRNIEASELMTYGGPGKQCVTLQW